MASRDARVAGYCRISKEDDASTSVDKQRLAIEAECARRGWAVTEWFIDEGVSGSKQVRRPARDDLEARLGEFDVLMINTLDRLSRSTVDFFRIADRAHRSGCDIVAASDPLDFTTPMGRAMAGLLAIFAALEAETVGARVKATNSLLVSRGRRTGGQTPYGLRNVEAPDGAGYVLRPDPERAAVVREAAERIVRGESIFAVARDFTARGVETAQGGAEWGETSLGRLLRRPALAGMRVFRGRLVRGTDGMPLVDAEAAIFTPDEWRALQQALARRAVPRDRRRFAAGAALLHGIALCHEAQRLYLNRSTGRYVCRCRRPVAILGRVLEEYVEREFLRTVGGLDVVRASAPAGRDAAAIADMEAEVASTTAEMVKAEGDDLSALVEHLVALKQTLADLRSVSDAPGFRVFESTGQTYAAAWDAADTDGRRALLASVLVAVMVKPGTQGLHRFEESRVAIVWDLDESDLGD